MNLTRERRTFGFAKRVPTVMATIALLLASLVVGFGTASAGVRPSENTDVTEVGDVFQWLLPTLAFGSTFVAGSPEGKWWDKEGTWQFTKSATSTIITTQVLKQVAGKFRPGTFVGKGTSNKSFPSGHTSAAFAGASFMNTRYGPWWGVPFYAAAFFTAYSRVQADAHFMDDVTAGASIAVLYNFLWVTPQSWTERYAIMPMVTDGGAGVQVTVNMDAAAPSGEQTKKVKKKDPRFRFGFAFGPAKTVKNEVTSPATTGTTFDLADFENSDDLLTSSAVEFDFFMGKRHTLSFFWLPFENRDIGQFSSPVFFAGQTYPADTPVISAWRHNEIKGVYRYNLTPDRDWQFQVGLGAFVQNTEVALATQDFAIESEVSDWVVLPVVHGSAEYFFTPKWSVSLYADGIYLSQDSYLDAIAAINYRISHHWDASLGYELYTREIDTSKLKSNTTLSVPFLAVAYSW